MPKAETNIVRFPMRRVVDARYHLSDNPEIAEIEIALKSALQAMKAADRQYRSLLMRSWHARGIKPAKSTLKWATEGAAGGDAA